MRFYLGLNSCCILFSLFFLACNQPKANKATHQTVYIQNINKKFTLYRNGKPFSIKGGAGFTQLKSLRQAGGNTIRTWDTAHLAAVLDSAQANNLAVIVGLPLPTNINMDEFYNNDTKTAKTEKDFTQFVNKYKNHPAVLAWCLGNELPFPYKPKYICFYTVFNNLVDMLHQQDPNHPVTTTVMNVQKQNIINIKLRTDIDFISFNIFGAIQTFKADLDKVDWWWSGPYLITEWGIEGPWIAEEQNAWGAYVENSSTKKAEQYLDTYKKYMPVNDKRFLGSMVFYWGQKQELTPTWFSLFDEKGNKTEVVNVMQYLWTGKQAMMHAPSVKFMLLNDKGARDNILLKPNTIANGKLYFNNADTAKLTYKWELLPEDWYKINGIFSRKKPKEIKGAITANSGTSISFKVPANEGPYRLYVYIYNNNGCYATSNTPFYVVKNP